MTERISFLLIEAHPIFRQEIIDLIQSDSRYQVVVDVESVDQALISVQRDVPDIAIVDISLFEETSLEFIRTFHTEHPDVPVLAISLYDEPVQVRRAVAAGARGYITKYATAATIREAISAVLAGRTFIPRPRHQP